MSQGKFKMSLKLSKWREWMQAIEPEIRLLLRDARTFWELRIIIHGHQRTQGLHYGYLERSYLAHALMGLRRQLKPDKGRISLVGLLNDIAKNPEELSVSYFESVCSDPNEAANFAPYVDVDGAHVCPQMIAEDIRRLTLALDACEKFVDERLSYLEKHEVEVAPPFKEFKDCFKVLDKTYVKYHLLFYADGLKTLQPPRQAGTLKGLIKIGDDFDAELPEFTEYMR
jgi:hypothetical protein